MMMVSFFWMVASLAMCQGDKLTFTNNLVTNDIIDSNSIQDNNNFDDDNNIIKDVIDNDIVSLETNSTKLGSLPPVLKSSSKSCSCQKLLLSSLGDAQRYHSELMGTYRKGRNPFSSHYYYKGPLPAEGKVIYMLSQGWMVGPTKGSPTGWIHNPHKYDCAYEIPTDWMVFYNNVWHHDPTLVLRCIN